MIAFIIGTGRCGTNILSQMLDAHSEICVPHELQILFEYSQNGRRLYEVFATGENKSFASADYISLVKNRCPHRFDLYFDYESFFKNIDYPILDLKWLVHALYEEIAISRGKSIFFEQTPWYGQRIDILNDLFPEAKYIHMVRDGRDVAISFARTPWWHDSIEENLLRWERELNHIDKQVHNLLDPRQVLTIRYEDLVDSPEKELRRCCTHLGVEFENSMLDASSYIDYSQFHRINQNAISSVSLNNWRETKTSPTFDGSRYAWKKSTDFDFGTISKNIIQSLNYYGYEG